ncbi:hypothetical protein TCAL_10602 [Tigriopus californicus]|uniref:DNA replication complex GINS protein PSF3 n=1 Tax=Tigriopus californicus TaxID=6832 RepID=A0A553P3C9_TIGCA|nr:DNA replication complex GINS protein PSF3-like [Tigriopus californicus]TRY72142.1 hypothetical protein TCAL_10602 [Tigriopus californicus]|eukprot:TCALIF_10602-PA protein Name:"Similar to GINS3 DNA replication complex GINS protein PSF3 (Pongo abelii)" AED:0.05 eAED:0.19 QI:0/0/0/1/1/1/2/0/223
MSYFSFDDILASQERLPLKTLASVTGCAFLAPSISQHAHSDDEDDNGEGVTNPSSDSSRAPDDLRAGVKMELPFWMTLSLLRAKVAIDVGVPPIFTLERRPILRADPVSLNLPKVGPKHFYRVGAKLLRFKHSHLGQGDDHLGSVLVDMIMKRFRYILDSSQHCQMNASGKETDILDVIEKELFQVGKQSRKQIEDWLFRRTHKMDMADLVYKNNRKRKAHEI